MRRSRIAVLSEVDPPPRPVFGFMCVYKENRISERMNLSSNTTMQKETSEFRKGPTPWFDLVTAKRKPIVRA